MRILSSSYILKKAIIRAVRDQMMTDFLSGQSDREIAEQVENAMDEFLKTGKSFRVECVFCISNGVILQLLKELDNQELDNQELDDA